MKLINILLFFLLSLLLFSGCSGNTKNIQQFPLTEENVHVYIDKQKILVKNDEENAAAHFNLARSYFFIKKYGSAENHARRATRYDPLNPAYYELLGSLAFVLERYGDAVTEYTTAVRISPERVSSYLKLASTYERINDDGRAISSLEQALQIDRYYVEALYNLARIYLRQREF